MQSRSSRITVWAAAALLAAGVAPAQERRVRSGLDQAAGALASGAARYHVLIQGTVSEADAAVLLRRVEEVRPATAAEAQAALKGLRIDGSVPSRISTNFTVGRQTQSTSFGDRAQPSSGSAGSGASSAAYAATGRETVVVLANTEQDERDARQIVDQISKESGAAPEARTRHDTAKNTISNVRALRAPSGAAWTLISGNGRQ